MDGDTDYDPFDLSQLLYYEKAPHEEDETHQILPREDISIRLAEDLSFTITGVEGNDTKSMSSDIRLVESSKGKFEFSC